MSHAAVDERQARQTRTKRLCVPSLLIPSTNRRTSTPSRVGEVAEATPRGPATGTISLQHASPEASDVITGQGDDSHAFADDGLWLLRMQGRPEWSLLDAVGTGAQKCYGHSVCYSNGVLIFFGGRAPASKLVDQVSILAVNVVPAAWTQIHPVGPSPGPRYATCAVQPKNDSHLFHKLFPDTSWKLPHHCIVNLELRTHKRIPCVLVCPQCPSVFLHAPSFFFRSCIRSGIRQGEAWHRTRIPSMLYRVSYKVTVYASLILYCMGFLYSTLYIWGVLTRMLAYRGGTHGDI